MRNLIFVASLAVVGVLGCGARETTVNPPAAPAAPAAPPNVTVVAPPAPAAPAAPPAQVNVNTPH